MQKNMIVVVLLVNLTLCYYAVSPDEKLVDWYPYPAKKWVEALPVGNGRLGAMLYCGPFTLTLQLNECTVLAGKPNRIYRKTKKAFSKF